MLPSAPGWGTDVNEESGAGAPAETAAPGTVSLGAAAQSKLTISTQFEPFPVGYFCSRRSAPDAWSIA